MKVKNTYKGLVLLLGIGVEILIFTGLSISAPAQSQPQGAGSGAPVSGSFEGFRMEDAVINVANTTGKAVVSITVEHITKVQGRPGARRFYFNSPDDQSSENDPFRKFFD
ncbi:MAG: hypothetical protein V1919_04385, partial [Candidatus Omnitrophota bacterium]